MAVAQGVAERRRVERAHRVAGADRLHATMVGGRRGDHRDGPLARLHQGDLVGRGHHDAAAQRVALVVDGDGVVAGRGERRAHRVVGERRAVAVPLHLDGTAHGPVLRVASRDRRRLGQVGHGKALVVGDSHGIRCSTPLRRIGGSFVPVAKNGAKVAPLLPEPDELQPASATAPATPAVPSRKARRVNHGGPGAFLRSRAATYPPIVPCWDHR